MSSRLLLLCGALSAGVPVSAWANVLWSGDFETGDLTQWSSKLDAHPGTTDRLVVIPSPAQQGRYAMKVTVKPGDLDNNGNRAEVVLRDRMFHQGDEVWFHWYTMFPSDYQVTTKWALFTQWHSGNPYGVPLGFNLHGTRLSMRVMGHKYDAAQQWSAGTLWTAQLEKGKWMEFLVRVKWSDGNDGFIEVWKDRQLVVPKTFHPTLDPGDYVYLKQGFYRDRTIDYDQTIFHDGMTIYGSRPAHLFETPPDAGTGGTPDAGTGPVDAGPTDPPDAGTGEPTDGGTGHPDPDDDGGPIPLPGGDGGPDEGPPALGCASTGGPRAFASFFLVVAAALYAMRRKRQA